MGRRVEEIERDLESAHEREAWYIQQLNVTRKNLLSFQQQVIVPLLDELGQVDKPKQPDKAGVDVEK